MSGSESKKLLIIVEKVRLRASNYLDRMDDLSE